MAPASAGSRGAPFCPAAVSIDGGGPDTRQPSQASLLTRHFFRRVLDNDLVSPGEDLHAPLAAILAVLMTVVGGVSAILILKYNRPTPIPFDERLAMALDDKVLLLGCAMVVMALVTLLVWDSLSLDRRDVAVLGALPIRSRTLLLSKTASLGGLAAALAVALSVPSAVPFTVVVLAQAPVGVLYALRSMGAQAAAVFLGCTFVFLALVSLRALACLVLPASLARRALLAVQCVFIPALFALLLVLPLLAMMTRPAIEAGSRAALAWPPLWFLGINDVLVGHDLPMLRELARLGVVALAATAALACATYLLAFRRDLERFKDRPPDGLSRTGGAGATLLRTTIAVLVADPLARASCAFTVITLVRSPRHRLYLVGYLGAGFALACASVAASYGRVQPAMLDLTPIALAVQFNLLFFLLVGVRIAATIPADLQAAWLFRFLATSALSRHLAGTRCAVVAFGVVPMLLLLAPVHALLWGWYAAAVHGAWGLGFALAMWTVLFWEFDTLPFACAATPGGSRLTNRLWLYITGYLLAVYAPAHLERALITRPELAMAWAALAVSCAATLVVRRPSRVRRDRLPNFEEPSGEVQQLGLGTLLP